MALNFPSHKKFSLSLVAAALVLATSTPILAFYVFAPVIRLGIQSGNIFLATELILGFILLLGLAASFALRNTTIGFTAAGIAVVVSTPVALFLV